MVLAAGWWLAIVELTPAGMRPFIGGSQNNNIFDLTFGYNGFGRLTGNETGSVGTGLWGKTGITRMFDGVMGGQIAWLIPAALIFAVAALWITRRAGRTDHTRAMIIVWGGWLVVTALVFSYMKGIFHEYYTVALAPAIAVLIGVGADVLWRHRRNLTARVVLATAVIATNTVVVAVARPFGRLAPVAAQRCRRWWPHCRRGVADRAAGVSEAVDGIGGRCRCRVSRRPDGMGVADRVDSARRFDRHRRPDRASCPRRSRWTLPGRWSGTTSSRFARRSTGSAGPTARRVPWRRQVPGCRQRRSRTGRWWLAEQQQPERPGRCRAAAEQRSLHLGRRGHRFERRLGLPAGNTEAGDGGRWLQRFRPVTDPR